MCARYTHGRHLMRVPTFSSPDEREGQKKEEKKGRKKKKKRRERKKNTTLVLTFFFKRKSATIKATKKTTMRRGLNNRRTTYADTFEFDVVVVVVILVVIPASIFCMQSKRSKTKRTCAFVLLAASFLYLAIFEGVVRLRETERVNEIGLRGSLYPERMRSTWKKERPFRRKRRTIVEKKASSSSSLSETTTHVLTSRRKTTLRYFSLNDAPGEKDELFREEKILASKALTRRGEKKPIAVHVEQKFSGGDAFFRDAFKKHEKEENGVRTAEVSFKGKKTMEEDVGTASVTSDGTSTLTPQILQSIFPETSYRAVFVIRDPRDVITSSYLSIISTLDAWARTKRDDLKGLSFQLVMRNLNAEVALNVEIARFMSASTDVPFFTGLDNAATAEIEKSNGAYANAILSFAEAMLDSEDSTMKDTTIFVKYTDLLTANSTGFRKLSQFLRGDASLEQSFLAAAASLRSRVETEPSLIASLVSKNDDTFYRHKITVDNVRKSTDEIATPPNIFKLHFTERNVENFSLLGRPLLNLLGIEPDDAADDLENLYADFDAIDGALLSPWKRK